jgi:hypothetical protein
MELTLARVSETAAMPPIKVETSSRYVTVAKAGQRL